MLSSDPAFTVIGEARDGAEAIRKAVELTPDLITMDVHMPVADGIDATKAIMREAPTPILVVSSIANTDVELSLNAIQAGALMVVEKPSDPQSPSFSRQRDQLLTMAKAMSEVKVVRRWSGGSSPTYTRSIRRPNTIVRLVAIGTSTGGPAALRRILLDLPGTFPVPILAVQHIARGFIEGLVKWLGMNCALRVKVAVDGELLDAGTVYVAPDDHHLGASTDGRVRLSSIPPIGGFRPSADHLFESCGRSYGADMIAVILTGMGRDGTDGLQTVHAAGGRIIAQDEATSVVYGMAREAVRSGAVDEILPLEHIAARLGELAS